MKKTKDLLRKNGILHLLHNRTFRKNFALLSAIILVVFLLFSLFTFHQTGTLLEQELLTASRVSLENTAQAVDSHIRDIHYILSMLETNPMARLFFSTKNPYTFYDNFYEQLQEYMEACVNSHSSIDSIYLYSTCANRALTQSSRYKLQDFEDTGWLKDMDLQSTEIQVIFRAKNNYYPYLITLIKPVKLGGYTSYIVINMDAGSIPSLEQFEEQRNQNIYMISPDGRILYQYDQSSLFSPISDIAELSHFDALENNRFSFHKEGNAIYTYNQIKSSRYNWYYVSVNHTTEYASQLSGSRAMVTSVFTFLLLAALFFALLFSARTARPIQDLLDFLEAPNGASVTELKDNREIAQVAAQILQYVQQNRSLSDELADRINSQNEANLVALQSQINPHFLFNTLNLLHIQQCEALGYDHDLPKLTLKVSKLLRYAIDGIDLVPLSTELEYAKIYVAILSNRYNNQFKIIYNISDSCLSAGVPKLIIQPLLENAVFHGLAHNMAGSVLEVSCYTENSDCIISVRDNGSGMPPETLEKLRANIHEGIAKRGGIGIKNVATRMHLLYADSFTMEIESREGEGSTFTMRFPYQPV